MILIFLEDRIVFVVVVVVVVAVEVSLGIPFCGDTFFGFSMVCVSKMMS